MLDRAAVDALAAEADVLVHLAFIIMGGREETREVNLRARATCSRPRRRRASGSSTRRRSPPTASTPTTRSRSPRTSPPRGSDALLLLGAEGRARARARRAIAGADVEAYVFRPCIVAGPDAPMLLDASIPQSKLPGAPTRCPVLPDPGVRSSSSTTTTSRRRSSPRRSARPAGHLQPGRRGHDHARDLARALGWFSVPVPRPGGPRRLARRQAAARPADTEWLVAGRVPVVMDTPRAATELGWEPRYSTRETLGGASRGVARRARRGCARR